MKLPLDKLNHLVTIAENNYSRLPVIIRGDKQIQHQIVEKFLGSYDQKNIVWIANQTPKHQINRENLKAKHVIGKEFKFIVFDLHTLIDPNLFAALSGTLRGGGLFIIFTPPIQNLRQHSNNDYDRFTQRIINIVSESRVAIQLDTCEINNSEQTKLPNSPSTLPINRINSQQDDAIKKIVHVVKGHRNRPLVLLADRGRGKSASIGIAVSKLMNQGTKNIIITAPSLDACAIAFKHVKINLSEANVKHGIITFNSSTLVFVSPDTLINRSMKTDLLIIDEAAGISPYILEKLLNQYSRIVFSSTIHGYEGSGHCFSIKFFKHLDKEAPGWTTFQLETPLRWNPDDPLEKLTNQLFLLKPENNATLVNSKLSDLHIEKIDVQSLIENEQLLSEFYDLLRSAHYKTQPSDLMQIVNNPNITLYVVKNNNRLVSAALTILEGDIAPSICEQVYLGNRRIKGHLIPQSLLMHLGIKEAGKLRYLRVMRIAVRPESQSCGIGSLLIEHLKNEAVIQKVDFIAASFGSSQQLLNFWGKHNFTLARVGHHKKSQINAFSALMLHPLSSAAKPVNNQAKLHFKHNFKCLLKENLHLLDKDITLTIIKDFVSDVSFSFSDSEWASLTAFSNHNQTYEDNLFIIQKFAYFILAENETYHHVPKISLELLLLKVLYGKSWPEISEQLEFTGKNQALIDLRRTISTLMSNFSLR